MSTFSTALVQIPLRRGVDIRRALLPVAGLAAVAFVAARLARDLAHPADGVLLQTVAPLVIPLATFAVVRATLGGRSLADAGELLLFFGARPRAVAAVHVLVAAFLAALAAVLATIVALVTVHAAPDDLLRSSALAALAGAAYGAVFAAGASFGRNGGGAVVFLAVDAVLGAGTTAVAALTPRSHLRGLFGGVPPGDVSSRGSCVALVVMIALALLVGTFRAGRPRR